MRTRRQYTREFKEDAVSLVTEQGYKVAEAA
jgi:transposase-like protein